MLGMLGQSFLGNRLFYVISKRREEDTHISVEDYLVYHDMIYYGTEIEKNKISFLLLDLDGTEKVTQEVYEKFWL